jgi:hypothetical protein
MEWQHISLAVTVKGPMYCLGLMMCCEMKVKWLGMLGVSVRKMKTDSEDGDGETDW